jgi:hypothetical protein
MENLRTTISDLELKLEELTSEIHLRDIIITQLWFYHPQNPNSRNLLKEYKNLNEINEVEKVRKEDLSKKLELLKNTM